MSMRFTQMWHIWHIEILECADNRSCCWEWPVESDHHFVILWCDPAAVVAKVVWHVSSLPSMEVQRHNHVTYKFTFFDGGPTTQSRHFCITNSISRWSRHSRRQHARGGAHIGKVLAISKSSKFTVCSLLMRACMHGGFDKAEDEEAVRMIKEGRSADAGGGGCVSKSGLKRILMVIFDRWRSRHNLHIMFVSHSCFTVSLLRFTHHIVFVSQFFVFLWRCSKKS